ncbi:hypothetical protein mRhiFer1_008462 [Rhinolophus ferrumequinum]|uniref:Uncharacterized protein n=1 Tax=Rhinolophus ferrumequinum TaxID=59479 RepID=A0A7J7V848_RHIFE|nr:uncharacterized protein LOC117033019 [Rhinolophus ferrumequinum]KAF6321347.1 hypothetical protein mRhiFer1_008462 [Rhinolophus ferrumequinum]
MHRGGPGPMSRWSGMLEASVTPGPWLGPAARVPLQATSPEPPRARAGPGARKTHPRARPGGRPRALPFGEVRASVQQEAGLGFLPPPVFRPRRWEPGLFTQSQVTFEVEELENHRKGTCTDLVVTPPPSLNTLWVPPCFGTQKGELTRMVKKQRCGVRRGGVVYVWDSVNQRCVMRECGRAPRLPRGELGGRGFTPGSPRPGAGQEREGYLRSCRGCGLPAALIPARREECARREPGVRSREPRQVRGSFRGRSGLRWLGKAGTRCLPATNRHRGEGMEAKRKSRMPESPADKPVEITGLWNPRQTRSIGRSSCGSPGC